MLDRAGLLFGNLRCNADGLEELAEELMLLKCLCRRLLPGLGELNAPVLAVTETLGFEKFMSSAMSVGRQAPFSRMMRSMLSR